VTECVNVTEWELWRRNLAADEVIMFRGEVGDMNFLLWSCYVWRQLEEMKKNWLRSTQSRVHF